MKFQLPTIKAKIIKRYKRFLVDAELTNGDIITAHSPNTGSMKTCWEPGWDILLTQNDDPKRKLKYTLEMSHNGKTWIGLNTGWPNKMAVEAINEGVITELQGYETIKPEAKIGKSRIDLLLSNGDSDKCYVEIKNVTLIEGESKATFPDAVTERGQKHLMELMDLKEQGIRACMLYIVQREDVDHFGPAEEIDPEYARLLRLAHSKGVEILAYQCSLDEKQIKITKPIKITL